jgi:hypothetical protein
VAVFDVVLFMPLMLVALLFMQSAFSVKVSVSQEVTNGSRYANQALNTLLISTVPSTQTLLGKGGQATTAQNWNVRSLLLWDAYLLSCGTATQPLLNQPGWMGWSINATALTIAEGAALGATPTTFARYYLQIDNWTTPSGCPGSGQQVHVVWGEKPPAQLTDVFTSDNFLIPPALPGEEQIQVVMGVWEPS